MVRGLKRENLRYKAEADESLGTQRQERVMEQLKEENLRSPARRPKWREPSAKTNCANQGHTDPFYF